MTVLTECDIQVRVYARKNQTGRMYVRVAPEVVEDAQHLAETRYAKQTPIMQFLSIMLDMGDYHGIFCNGYDNFLFENAPSSPLYICENYCGNDDGDYDLPAQYVRAWRLVMSESDSQILKDFLAGKWVSLEADVNAVGLGRDMLTERLYWVKQLIEKPLGHYSGFLNMATLHGGDSEALKSLAGSYHLYRKGTYGAASLMMGVRRETRRELTHISRMRRAIEYRNLK